MDTSRCGFSSARSAGTTFSMSSGNMEAARAACCMPRASDQRRRLCTACDQRMAEVLSTSTATSTPPGTRTRARVTTPDGSARPAAGLSCVLS
jgi:hypothetical protein